MNNDSIVEVPLVEFINENGSKITFKYLSRIMVSNDFYVFLTPFVADEATGAKQNESPADVFVMKEVDTGNGILLEPVTDVQLAKCVFDVFRQTDSDKYKFVN